MQSPFPGMDPFVEAAGLWGDFHDEMIRGIKAILQEALPATFLVRTGTRSYIMLTGEDEKDERAFLPDVHITAPRKSVSPTAVPPPATPATTAVTDPVDLRAFISDAFEETFLDIFEAGPDRRLVTSVEVLSPSNKRRNTEGWNQYQRKRQALLLGKANLVELDLLRGGDRMPMLDPWPGSPYTVLVARKERAPRCLVWPAYFDRPLPAIPVPLEPPHPDVIIDLQPLLTTIYTRGRYHEDIDYTRSPGPPWTKEEAAWLRERLHGKPPPAKRRKPNKRG